MVYKTHGKYYMKEYRIWYTMIQRCHNKNSTGYYKYGARGITVCDRWLNSFDNFYEDMGSRPLGLTLERKDNNGNYELDNCVWATSKEQAQNRRLRKDGKLNREKVNEIRELYKSNKFTRIELSKIFNVTPQYISHIMHNKNWKENELINNDLFS